MLIGNDRFYAICLSFLATPWLLSVSLTATTAAPPTLPASIRPWRDYVTQCVDTLIEHGTDRYGPQRSPMIMAVIDVKSLTSPAEPKLYDSLVRLEDRLHRRGERGSNLWYDQALLRCLYQLTELTGNKHYGEAADAYVEYFFKNCRKANEGGQSYRNGMPVWGTHIYWDCYQDIPGGDGVLHRGEPEARQVQLDLEGRLRDPPEHATISQSR